MSAFNARLVTSKTCSRCEGIKSTKDFGKDASKPDRLSIYCYTCVRTINKAKRSQESYNPKRRANAHKYAKQNREWRLKTKYGITIQQYEEMFDAQDRKCGICETNKSDTQGAFVIDHCHATGEIRGILCSYCNKSLGMFKDSVDTLNKAVVYLNKIRK